MANTLLNSSPLSGLLEKIDAICVFCSESTETQGMLNTSLQKTLDLLRAARGSIYILDSETKDLILKASIGSVEDKEMIEKVLKLKKALLSGAAACSPLMIKDKLIGVISISSKVSAKSFTLREFQLLNFLSHQIALNYQRIMMTHQLESQERLASLGKLAGGIAHEFNNPLDGVMRYNNLCLSRVNEDDVLREYLTEVQMGLKRMANIVKNLLACARQVPHNSSYKIDIHKTIEQALREFYPYLASKNINLKKNFGQDIPEITDWGMERVVSNLVKNAIDAIDKNGTIEISTLMDEGFIKLKVADSGRGIAEENMNKIFEPFFTTKDIDKGCGLGLTVVNEVVKCYNGQIKVRSAIGGGTAFTIKLPVSS